MKVPARKRIWSLENELFLKMKLSDRKWNRMPENEITRIFFEIDKGYVNKQSISLRNWKTIH